MKIKYILLITSLFVIACGGDKGYVRIELEADKHLEDTKAGAFIKKLNLDYNNGLFLTTNISQQLDENATLKDSYTEKEDITVHWWEIEGIIILEKSTSSEEGIHVWFEIPLDKEGIKWYELIGQKANDLKPNREYECSVVISSKKDNCRLILCGFGRYCQSMLILEGS